MIFTVRDHEFVDPITADTKEEVAKIAVKVLGFDYKIKSWVINIGALKVLEDLGYHLDEE